MSSPYSVVEVKEFKLAAESEAPSDSPAADDEWGRDIVDLSEPTAVPSGQLFHPLIAKVNQALLGMNTFGTGDRSDVGGVGYRLWPTYTGICFADISSFVLLSWVGVACSRRHFRIHVCANDDW